MKRKVLDYGAALAVSLVALALTYYVPLLERIPWTAAFIAVAIIARVGGLGPAVLATTLASVGVYTFVLSPDGRSGADSTAVIETLAFAVGALFIAYFMRGHSRALSSLRESEMHYRSVTETASDVIVTIDSHSTILSINPAVKKVFGYNPEELIGKPLLTLMPEKYRTAHLAGIASNVKTGERHIPWSGVQLSGRTKTGGEIPIEISFGSYSVDGSKRFTGFIRDISDRRAAQAALVQSEKLAAVGRLASSIAREINNPLEAITNLIYLSRGNIDMEEVQGHLGIAEQEVSRISVIANQTLRFHKDSATPTEVQTAELIRSSLSLYHGRLTHANVSVMLRESANRPVLCVEGQIRQVLTNLIGNAIDALSPAGGRILLRTRDAVDWKTGRPGVVITVADSGSGMSQQTREKIFEPFFTTKGEGGSGLGLWISSQIVEQNHGSMRVSSSQRSGHNGTVFTLFLPSQA